MKEKILNNRKTLFVAVSVFLVVISTLSYSYGLFTSIGEGDGYNLMTVGNLDVSYVDGGTGYGETLGLTSKKPMSDSEGKKLTPYRFSVENNGKNPFMYIVKIKDDETIIDADGCSNNQIDRKFIKVQFDNEEPVLLSSVADSDYLFYTGALVQGDSDIHEVRVWLDSSMDAESSGKHFHGKVVVEPIQGDSIVANKVFTDIGSNCKVYDDGTDTYLVGACSKNYVSFAGSVWQVISKNNDTNTVKLLATNSILDISFNPKDNNSYKDGNIDKYLNETFYQGLKEFDSYLVKDAMWNVGVSADVPTKELVNQKSVSSTIGILNAYEYNLINDKSIKEMGLTTSYLNNQSSWWLATQKGGSYVYYVNSDGKLSFNASTFQYGLRPVINLRANVRVSYTEKGDGTITSPYVLKLLEK